MNQWKGANHILIYPSASPTALLSLPAMFSRLDGILGCLEGF